MSKITPKATVEIDRLLERTHALACGHILHLHRGELTYVSLAAFDSDAEYRREEIVVDLQLN